MSVMPMRLAKAGLTFRSWESGLFICISMIIMVLLMNICLSAKGASATSDFMARQHSSAIVVPSLQSSTLRKINKAAVGHRRLGVKRCRDYTDSSTLTMWQAKVTWRKYQEDHELIMATADGRKI